MRKTATHTPGPWHVDDGHIWHTDEQTGMGYRFKPIAFGGGCLAWVADDEGDCESGPNAALIAAAPDLAETLQDMLEWGSPEVQRTARAALKRAGVE